MIFNLTPKSLKPAINCKRLFSAPGNFLNWFRVSPTTVASRDNDFGFLHIDETAYSKLSQLWKNNANSRLRISIEGGGCHGYQYNFDLEEGPSQQDDTEFAFKTDEDSETPTHTPVIVDSISLSMLDGSKLTYTTENILSQRFEIHDNPKASSGCGCHSSFGPTK